MYYNGKGVIQGNVYAHMWWNIAASSGVNGAVKNRDMVTVMMTLPESKAHRSLSVNVSVRNTRIVELLNHSAAQKDAEISESPV